MLRLQEINTLYLVLLVIACSALGCSSDGPVSVEGTVTYDGQPLDVGTITLLPSSGEGVKSGGLIDNGKYVVEPKLGPMPGPHRVEIHWAKPTGKKYRNEFGEELHERKEGLPDKYHTNSTLTAEIKSGNNVLNFQLEK